MKDFVKGLIVVAAVLLAISIAPTAISLFRSRTSLDDASVTDAIAVMAVPKDVNGYRFIETVNVYDIVSGEKKLANIEDFLVSAVFGAISPTAEPELLKAQSVLMYTYILGRRLQEKTNATPALLGCDISTDNNSYIRLMTKEEIENLYKDKAEEYIEKVRKSVEETIGEYVAYDGKPIITAYCFSCGGRTESALSVLGEDVPYLRSVESEYDSDYLTEAVFTSDELFARISTQSNGITLLGDPDEWIVLSQVSDSMYVKKVILDSRAEVSGEQLAMWLNIPSAKFTVNYSEELDRFTFTIYGSGHLVGLSQYGANEMAKTGYTYTQILGYFFTDTDIIKSSR